MSRGQRSGIPLVVVVGILMAPPVGTLLVREYRPVLVDLGVLPSPKNWRDASEADRVAALEEFENDLRRSEDARVRLELALERAKHRLGVVEGWRRDFPDASVRSVRVLPTADPSPIRHALWIASDNEQPFLRNSALVSDEGRLIGVVPSRGHKIVGHVERPSDETEQPGSRAAADTSLEEDDDRTFKAGRFVFARVQTTLDPGFRIRGRVGAMWGFLQGTGKVDSQGLPLLRLHLLSGDATLEPRQRVYSDGDDGRFPAGIAIGEVVEQTRLGSDPEYSVRATTVDPRVLTRAMLLADELRSAPLEGAGMDSRQVDPGDVDQGGFDRGDVPQAGPR